MPHWDIFCRVIDNFGDAGVCWRLARQLATEHNFSVRLWIDDLTVFARLCPAASDSAPVQTSHGVSICHWPTIWQPTRVADVVIEAFACALPEAYITAMAARANKPLWLNLEYLSAEDWVDDCHGLPSLQNNGLRKFFFFPGFTARSGGLLREQQLLIQRQAVQADSARQQQFWHTLGLPVISGARRVSLFSYETDSLSGWLDALANDARVNQLVVPEGRVVAPLQCWLGVAELSAGANHQRGQLHIHVLPFLAQESYDQLLWCCDINIVRGEDSLLRALWAGRPLLWHIYPQQEAAHQIKLEAFLAYYTADFPDHLRQALAHCHRGWSDGTAIAGDWQRLLAHEETWQRAAEQRCLQQYLQPDLVTSLVQFCEKWL